MHHGVTRSLGGKRCTGVKCNPHGVDIPFFCNFLGLLLFEILGVSQIYTRGFYAPLTPPSKEMFVPKARLQNI